MKQVAFFTILFLTCTVTAFSQPEKTLRPYRVWIKKINVSKPEHGYLSNCSDSTLTLNYTYNLRQQNFSTTPVNQIEYVAFRKLDKPANGTLLGAFSGFIVGFTTGLMLGDDPPNQWFRMDKEQKGVAISIFTLPIGAIVGGLIAKRKIYYYIDGSSASYARQKEKIRRYQLTR
jgi:hypothetical protein